MSDDKRKGVEINGQFVRDVEGVDSAVVREAFTRLSEVLPERNFERIVDNYFFGMRECSQCKTVFLPTSGKVDWIPHWLRGKNRGGKQLRGRPHELMHSVPWVTGQRICLSCALTHVDAVVDFFVSCKKPAQLRILKALRETAQYQAEDWYGTIACKFFTRLAERLLEHVSTRGRKPVEHLTSILTSCNLVT